MCQVRDSDLTNQRINSASGEDVPASLVPVPAGRVAVRVRVGVGVGVGLRGLPVNPLLTARASAGS